MMYFIISWQEVLLFLALYFLLKYVNATALKFMAGCSNPFNPLYSYQDYPAWRKGYRRGWLDLDKRVKKIIADFSNVSKEPKPG